MRDRRRALILVIGVAALSAGATPGRAQIPASRFFKADTRVKITPSPRELVVFDELENREYFLEGRDLELKASKIKVVGRVVISGYRAAAAAAIGEGSPGANGVSRGQAPECRSGAPGGAGEPGMAGPPGAEGRRGSVMQLDIGEIVGPGTIAFRAVGQDGAGGGRGGRGGDGGKGEDGGQSKSTWQCECGGGDGGRGGNAGNGGPGGPGGAGGDGGIIMLSGRSGRVRQRLDLDVSGGKGGPGGPMGEPGRGGRGGGMGRGGGFCGGGRGAGDGANGSPGPAGPTGRPGRQGSIAAF